MFRYPFRHRILGPDRLYGIRYLFRHRILFLEFGHGHGGVDFDYGDYNHRLSRKKLRLVVVPMCSRPEVVK